MSGDQQLDNCGVCQVGHQFYLFKDEESGDIRVLYKRKRG
jgi:Sigma 54 modulation/S30EA ribosomal protein C terminus